MQNATYLFDLDGTLIDSMGVFTESMYAVLDKYQVKYDDKIINELTPLGTEGILRYFLELGINASPIEILDFIMTFMLDAYHKRIPLKEGVFDTLRTLKGKGYSLNVLTASPHMTLDPCLKRLGVFDLFDNVWSCDDFSMTKSNPEIYKKVAEKLGVKPFEIIFVDDNIKAISTAKSAGLKVYGVYDKSSDDFVEDIKKIADGYFNNFFEMIK